jgi:hypothetical protein
MTIFLGVMHISLKIKSVTSTVAHYIIYENNYWIGVCLGMMKIIPKIKFPMQYDSVKITNMPIKNSSSPKYSTETLDYLESQRNCGWTHSSKNGTEKGTYCLGL